MSQLHPSDTIYFGQSLLDWVAIVHTDLCELYNLPKFDTTPGGYGYDSYACVLVAILSNVSSADIMGAMQAKLDVKKYVDLMHPEWSANYLKWKAITPGRSTNNPLKSINTTCRNDRATTSSEHLIDSDVELYRDVIDIVFDRLTKNVLNAGMSKLCI